MKKIHYYFCWFNDTMPERVAELLRGDLPNRSSLVSICTKPSEYDANDQMVKTTITEWLDPAGLTFDEYHLIDYRVTKEKARELLKNASAIFLHGGNAILLNNFLVEYDLPTAIKDSNAAVIIGASAGSMNMSTHWVADKKVETYSNGKVKAGTIYDGIGLDNFAVGAHYSGSDVEADQLVDELFALSQKIDVYVPCWESAIRSKDGKLGFVGKVFHISDSKIQKLDETEFVKRASLY